MSQRSAGNVAIVIGLVIIFFLLIAGMNAEIVVSRQWVFGGLMALFAFVLCIIGSILRDGDQ